MKNRTDAEIIRAGAAGFGSAALITPTAFFILAFVRDDMNAQHLFADGGPIFAMVGTMAFIGVPAFAFGMIAMAGFLTVGARSPWFALLGIGIAALSGAFLEFDGSAIPDLKSAALIGLHVALACGITIIMLRRNIRTPDVS